MATNKTSSSRIARDATHQPQSTPSCPECSGKLVTANRETRCRECGLIVAIDGYHLIDEIDEPAPQLVEGWSSLPAAITLNSETGQQLLERLKDVVDEDFSRWLPARRGFPILYDEWGHALEEGFELEDSRKWLVPALALHETSNSNCSTQVEPSIPTKKRLCCRHCEEETIHVFDSRDIDPAVSASGASIWECNCCNTPRHGPDPK